MENPAPFHLEAHLERAPPRRRLASLPTPLEKLAVPGEVSAWVKRDDRSSDRYGGGKVRKLEFIFAQPEFTAAPRVRSIGAFGSHHLLALAIHGAQFGIGVDAVVAPQVVTKSAVRNLAALSSMGARFFRFGAALPADADGGRRWFLPKADRPDVFFDPEQGE